jgi:hypothetical protein
VSRSRWFALAAFALALPLGLFLGFTFVLGHGRVFPYGGVWPDRALFTVVALGLPAIVAWAAGRAVRSRGRRQGRP